MSQRISHLKRRVSNVRNNYSVKTLCCNERNVLCRWTMSIRTTWIVVWILSKHRHVSVVNMVSPRISSDVLSPVKDWSFYHTYIFLSFPLGFILPSQRLLHLNLCSTTKNEANIWTLLQHIVCFFSFSWHKSEDVTSLLCCIFSPCQCCSFQFYQVQLNTCLR